MRRNRQIFDPVLAMHGAYSTEPTPLQKLEKQRQAIREKREAARVARRNTVERVEELQAELSKSEASISAFDCRASVDEVIRAQSRAAALRLMIAQTLLPAEEPRSNMERDHQEQQTRSRINQLKREREEIFNSSSLLKERLTGKTPSGNSTLGHIAATSEERAAINEKLSTLDARRREINDELRTLNHQLISLIQEEIQEG